MFSKSKADKAKKRQPDKTSEGNKMKQNLSQFGLLEIPNVMDLGLENEEFDDDDNDDDLEAELLALTRGEEPQGIKKAKKMPTTQNRRPVNTDYSGRENSLDAEDDPELLAELSALAQDENGRSDDSAEPPHSHSSKGISSPTSPKRPAPAAPAIVRPSPFLAGQSVANLLQERILMYTEAEENALAAGDTTRAKRLTRGLKTLQKMIYDVDSGMSINEEDIPPAVLLKSSRNNSAVNLSDLSPPQPSTQNPPQPNTQTPPQPNTQTPPQPNTQTPAVLSRPASSQSATIPQNIIFNRFEDENGPTAFPQPEESSNSIEKPPPELTAVLQRQQEYKLAALNAKKCGDKISALEFMRIAKQLEPLVEATKSGQTVDLSSMPPPPESKEKVLNGDTGTKLPNPGAQNSLGVAAPQKLPTTQEARNVAAPAAAVPSPPASPSSPTSILEALEQRLAFYSERRDKAKEEGNARKERMNERIRKQVADAIVAHKIGRAIDLEDIPTPPGFPPIPAGGGVAATPAVASPTQPAQPTQPQPAQQKPGQQPTQPSQNTLATAQPKPKPQAIVKPNVRNAPQSRVERQLSVLKKRQDQFKLAALEAKKRGEIEQAKEYLRNFKGFDQLIDATHGGLPVDMNTVPIPPQEKLGSENTSMDFEVVEREDCIVAPPATDADVTLSYTKLEEDLINQIKMCAHTREHFKAVGDVASANRFEQLILHTKKDLDAVRVAFKRGDKPPRFHYESRSFTIIQCNTDLNDSDCEVVIVRGINLNVPNPAEVDTLVRYEFPYPNDAPPQEKTAVVKDTNNPEFNHKAVFSIDRKARALSRVFKRGYLKCQVCIKGGWFHRDSVLGSIRVPLINLETKCTLHESFDLVDEKKKMIGGKLEVKIRVRNPILSKQLEKVTEKWVVIDGF